MLHGWGMHSGLLREFAMQIAQHYQVILVDLPGHGHSAALDQYSMATVVAELACALPEPAVWLGWSMGGSVALQMAVDYPDQVKGLILVCANPKYSTSDDWPMAMDNKVLQEFVTAVRENDQITLAKFTGLMTQGEGKQTRELLRFVRKRLPIAPTADRNALLWGLDILQNADFRTVFSKTSQPLSVLLGEHDPLIPYRVADQIKLLHPDADIQIIENAGHVPFLSQQAQMVELVSLFMQRIEQQV